MPSRNGYFASAASSPFIRSSYGLPPQSSRIPFGERLAEAGRAAAVDHQHGVAGAREHLRVPAIAPRVAEHRLGPAVQDHHDGVFLRCVERRRPEQHGVDLRSPPAPANVRCSAAGRSSLSSSALLWCVRSTDCDPSTAGCHELGRGRLAAAGDHQCLAVRAERPLPVEALWRQRAWCAPRRGDGEDRLVGPVLGIEVDRRAVRRPCQPFDAAVEFRARFRSSRRSCGRSASGASDPIRAPASPANGRRSMRPSGEYDGPPSNPGPVVRRLGLGVVPSAATVKMSPFVLAASIGSVTATKASSFPSGENAIGCGPSRCTGGTS